LAFPKNEALADRHNRVAPPVAPFSEELQNSRGYF